jgi:hypothetical protein
MSSRFRSGERAVDSSDPALYASQVYREAYALAVAKIASRQLGEAFIDLYFEEQPEPMREAA